MAPRPLRPLPQLIFASRRRQLPAYRGHIVAQGVYVWRLQVELTHLVQAAMGSEQAMSAIMENVAVPGPDGRNIHMATETVLMPVVLGLIDVVMISNLLDVVIVSGYETFVSRMDLESHPDQPEWLWHANASVLEVKLATAIIGISSIHLLKTSIDAQAHDEKTLVDRTAIHIAFLLWAMSVAAVDRILPAPNARPAHAPSGSDSPH